MKIEKIPYKDIEILYTDLSNMVDIDEGLRILRQTSEVIGTPPQKSVSSLFNVTGAKFNSEFISEVKLVGKRNARYVQGTALIGLTSVTKLIAKTVIKISGRKAEFFDDVEAGKEWLYQVNKGTSK